MQLLILGFLALFFIDPALAAPAMQDTAPAWLTGLFGLLFNALGIGAGGTLATLVSGILWHLWSMAKAKANEADASSAESAFDHLRKLVQEGVFSAIGNNPPAPGEQPKLDALKLDDVVTAVKAQFAPNAAPDSDTIRTLARAAFGRIILQKG